jgi:exonuclease SbcC
MKPIYLEFCGLNSFSSKAEIDFSVLLTGGIFGIFGATGSGKSSILDAIHLALYGKVDRAATFNDCINQDSDSVSVTFDFEVVISGKRGQYRVKRETKRKSGSAKAYLYEKQGKEWFALAEGVSDVNKKVEEIVGLSLDDFKTCIALPQGEFAALVKSKLSERVKLMARLFNLEKYGERLFKSVNARYAEAQREVDRVRTLMVDNEGADEEKIALAQADVQNAEQETAEAKTQAAKIQQKYQELQAVQKEKRAYGQAVAQFTTMQARYDEMQQLQTLIGKYPTARAVADAYALQNRAKQTTENAKQNLLRADAGYEQAKTEREKAQRLAQESDVEERLLQARMDLQKVRDGADKIHAEQECLKQLNACKKEYAECRFNGVEEDYDTVRQTLEKEYDALGEDEDLLTYLKKNLKGVMLADAYKDVRADLRGIGEKYPQTQADIDQLIEKYYIQNQADLSETDVAAAQLRFKQAEQKRKQIKMQLDALEKRQQEFKAWQDKRK